MKKTSSLTFPFSLVQFAYWIGTCGVLGYAAVYLQALGFDNFTLGVVLALGSVLAALLGPALASYLDRHPSMPTASMNYPVFGLELLLAVILLLHAEMDFLTAAVYTLLIAVCESSNSVNMRFCGDAVNAEMTLNFGIARGIGSFGYIIPTVCLGILFRKLSPRVLPWAIILFLLMQIGANAVIGRSLRERVSRQPERTREKGDSMWVFLRSEPRFALLLVGSVLLFFGYESYAKFTINVVRNVGGDTGTMGILTGFTAAIEIPVLCCYFLLRRRWSASSLLRVSFLGFSLKALAIAAAATVPQLFLANSVQVVAYALYCSPVVEYVASVIPGRNSAKAQSMAFTATVVGAVLASLISGRLFDICTVKTTLVICFLVTVAGSAIACAGVKPTDR